MKIEDMIILAKHKFGDKAVVETDDCETYGLNARGRKLGR